LLPTALVRFSGAADTRLATGTSAIDGPMWMD
jgi:hypothetical protein